MAATDDVAGHEVSAARFKGKVSVDYQAGSDSFRRLVSGCSTPSCTETAVFLSRISASSVDASLAPCPALDLSDIRHRTDNVYSPSLDILAAAELSSEDKPNTLRSNETSASEQIPTSTKNKTFGDYEMENPYKAECGLATLAAAGARAQAIDSLIDTIKACCSSPTQNSNDLAFGQIARRKARRQLAQFQKSSLSVDTRTLKKKRKSR